MIDLYYWPTPNGWKISIMLEELGVEYNIIPVDIGAGDQFKPEFLKISPNNRMPAIVDHDVDGEPITVFESGAILLYLAEKYGKFIPKDIRGRVEVLEWLNWQMGGLGPMMGQVSHFATYAPQLTDNDLSYPIERYGNEAHRLLGVIDKRLASRDYLAGEYSIADMAAWPWAISYKFFGFDIEEFPNALKWIGKMYDRPAVMKGRELNSEQRIAAPVLSEETKEKLFRQK